jgi:hypothetical protein
VNKGERERTESGDPSQYNNCFFKSVSFSWDGRLGEVLCLDTSLCSLPPWSADPSLLSEAPSHYGGLILTSAD